MLSAEDRAIALDELAKRLTETLGHWRVDGEVVRSEGSAIVRVGDTCETAGVPDDVVHLDVELAFNPVRLDTSVFDCAVGGGSQRERAVRQAVDAWVESTAPPLLTFLAEGRPVLAAAHLHAGDPGGIPGWHCIAGPDVVYGDTDDGEKILDHLTTANVLQRVASALSGDALRPFLNGMKLLRWGSGPDSAEVRVNGRRHESASRALSRTPWPATRGFCSFRKFALLVGPE
jgi:hypothetical protein